MSILICATTYGGCGYIGEGMTFPDTNEKGDPKCPTCGQEAIFQLGDGNFDSLTNADNAELARRLLDEDNANIHGELLKFCVEEGFIGKNRLTSDQKAELGISECLFHKQERRKR